MLDKKINLNDDSLYVEKNEGTINYFQNNKELSTEEALDSLEEASIDLTSYTNKFNGEIHLKRSETNTLFEWVQCDLTEKDSKISLLVGNAGMGKSVILKDLIDLLNEQNIPVLGIKVDKILNAYTIKEIETELFLEQGIIPIFENLLKNNKKCVLIIDQIDALSQSLSSKRNALTTYDRLINHLKQFSNIRIVVSTRTYDLNHDPIIKNYKNYASLVNVSPLEIVQVNYILSKLKISIPQNNLHFLEFLRTPLHLNLFCTIGWSKNFEKTINLQFLYDEIWLKFIETDSLKYNIEPEKIITALQFIADSMNKRQQIVIDKRQLDPYSKEVKYLLQHNLLVLNNNKIQFIHQTLFDYTYARTFLVTQKDIKEWITNQHQGLFIRSQVRQLFSYLRNLDHNEYIKEIKCFLNENNYRLHLKMLLISDLAFYHDPSLLEKKVVRDIILPNPIFLEVFIESIQEVGWFSFLEDTSEFKNLLNSNDDKKINLVIDLCGKILSKQPNYIIEFLEKNITNINLIQFVLIRMQEKDVHLSFDLYKKTKHLWDIHFKQEYYFLEKALNEHPDFVIQELKEELTSHLQLEQTDYFSDNYMPNSYAVQNIYEKLYETHPITAIPFFVEVLQLITNKNSDTSSNKNLKFDFVFYLFRPEEESNYLHQKIYNNIIDFINKAKSTELDYLYLELLRSDIANLVAIGVLFLIQNKERYIESISTLFTTSHFFKEYDATEILKYNTHILLEKSYIIFSNEQQSNIIDAILRTQKVFYSVNYESFYTQKKVYTYYLKKTYTLLSFLPYKTIESNLLAKKIYQEGRRKYGIISNKKPQRIQVKSGYKSYKTGVYSKMTLNNLKKSFYKLNSSQLGIDNWDKPELEGHKNKFKELVKKNPEKYTSFIYELISDELVNISYIFVAIEALQETQYESICIEKIIKTLIKERFRVNIQSEDEYKIINLLRIVENHIETDSEKYLNIEIFNLIKYIALNFPDRQIVIKDRNQRYNRPIDIVTTGINSARGVAVQCLITCYKMSDYSDQIFETLNSVSENANEVTRSCIIYQAAYLNHLDIQKAYELYLKTVGDFNPLLLGIPFHNEHPLFYLMNYNFSGLKEVFEKAVETEIAGEAFSNFLINAYLNNKEGSYKLLLKLLNRNKKARNNTIHVIAKECLNNNKHFSKSWRVIQHLLKYDDKENGENYNNFFLKLKVQYCSEVVSFIDAYLKSSVSSYRNEYFFKYIRDLISEDSEKCLNWLLMSNPVISPERYHDNTALNILIESYNGIREYDKENILLEKAMDTFDNLLRIPEYRNGHLNKFLKELES